MLPGCRKAIWARCADGYLDSVQQVRGRGERCVDLPWSHEHYCAGHLFQAPVAVSRSTGETVLLDIAVKLADHLVATSAPGRIEEVDGHPVVEMGLVELHRETGTQECLDLLGGVIVLQLPVHAAIAAAPGRCTARPGTTRSRRPPGRPCTSGDPALRVGEP